MLEQPTPGALVLAGDRVALRGWAGGDGAMVVRARLAGGPWYTLAANLARPDLRQALPDGDVARGFAGFLPVPESAQGPQRVEVELGLEGQPPRQWVREIDAEAEALVHARWLSGLQAPAAAPPAAPWLTWYLRGEGEALATAMQALLPVCAGHGRVLPLAAAAGETPTTPWFGLLDAGDRLEPAAWQALAACLASADDAQALYADHVDSPSGIVVLKPGPSVLMADEPLLWDRGWLLRTSCHGRRAWELLTDAAARARLLGQPGTQVRHLPWPLTRETTPRPTAAPRAGEPPPLPAACVSVIVPTRLSDPPMLERCLEGLRLAAEGVAIDLVLVLNNLVDIDEAAARRFLARWPATVLHREGGFNWSALNNLGERHARGDWLLFLNDDVEPLHPGWLSALLRTAQRPGVGCVGARLRYPDGTLQHAGVWIDPVGAGRHHLRHTTGRAARSARWLAADREHSAVTGACLLTPRALFRAAGGFDETLPIVFNDVDYALRLRQRGWRSAVCAGAELLHHESVSRAGIAESADHQRFRRRWAALLPAIDPHRHPCLLPDQDDWQLDPDSRPPVELRP